MEERKADGIKLINWIFVLPTFLISFVFLESFFKIIVTSAIIRPISGNNLQLSFILNHLYDDLLCVAFSIYFSCSLAPSKKIIPASFYFIVILVMIPRQLERNVNLYGHLPWKAPFLITLYLLSGLIPIALILLNGYAERNRSNIMNME